MDRRLTRHRGCGRADGRIRGRARGEAMVEFVLVAPLLLLLLLAILEMGRVVDAWVVVHNAAREGARAGALAHPDPPADVAADAAGSYLADALQGRADISAGAVDALLSADGDVVVVQAEVWVDLFTPYMQRLLSQEALPVRAAVAMRRQ